MKKLWISPLILILSISATSQITPLVDYKVLKIKQDDSIQLMQSWRRLVNAIQTKNYVLVKESSLENIYGESLGHIWPGFSKEQSVPIDSFINIALIKHCDNHFLNIIVDSAFTINVIRYKNRKFPNIKLGPGNQSITLYNLYFVDYVPRSHGIRDQNYYEFNFIKINGKFKLFGIDLAWPSAIKQ